MECDASLDGLLDLDGQVWFVDELGEHWVKFRIRRVLPTAERPHGLDYAFTLHAKDGQRLAGFDNAHQARKSARPGGRGQVAFDHTHRYETIRQYAYTDASTLLEDFWTEVDSILKERGVVK